MPSFPGSHGNGGLGELPLYYIRFNTMVSDEALDELYFGIF